MMRVNYVVDWYGNIYYMSSDEHKARAFKRNIADREFAEELDIVSGNIDLSTAEIIKRQIEQNSNTLKLTSTKGL